LNVKDVLWFFICLNIAIYLVTVLNVLPIKSNYYTPEQLLSNFNVPDNWQQVVVPSSLAIGGVVNLIIGYGIAGTALLMVGVLGMFWTPAQIVVNGGLGQMLGWLGAPYPIQVIGNIFSAFVWMLFLIEYLGGRRVE